MFPSDLHCVREPPTHPPQPQSERIEAVPPGLPVPSLESRNTNFTFNIVSFLWEVSVYIKLGEKMWTWFLLNFSIFGGGSLRPFPLSIFSIKNINLGLCVCVCILSHSVISNSLQPYGRHGSCVYGFSQAGILEWFTMLSSRGSSQPRNRIHVPMSPVSTGGFFTASTIWEALCMYKGVIFSQCPICLWEGRTGSLRNFSWGLVLV